MGLACKIRKAWRWTASALFLLILVAEVAGWGIWVDITGKVHHPLMAMPGLFTLIALVELATKDSCPKEPGLLT
jgi:hypothetical protein